MLFIPYIIRHNEPHSKNQIHTTLLYVFWTHKERIRHFFIPNWKMQMDASSPYSPHLFPFSFIWLPLSIHTLFNWFHPTRRLPFTPSHPQIIPIDRESTPLSYWSSNHHIIAHTPTQSLQTLWRDTPAQKEAEKLNKINILLPRTSTSSNKSTHYNVLVIHLPSTSFYSIHRLSFYNTSLNIPPFSLLTLSTSTPLIHSSSIPLHPTVCS